MPKNDFRLYDYNIKMTEMSLLKIYGRQTDISMWPVDMPLIALRIRLNTFLINTTYYIHKSLRNNTYIE